MGLGSGAPIPSVITLLPVAATAASAASCHRLPDGVRTNHILIVFYSCVYLMVYNWPFSNDTLLG